MRINEKLRFVKDWKSQMLDYQTLKGWKGKFFPLFLSQDPPTALRSASEILTRKMRYVQGEWAVMWLTCVEESERQFGFVQAIPWIVIHVDTI